MKKDCSTCNVKKEGRDPGECVENNCLLSISLAISDLYKKSRFYYSGFKPIPSEEPVKSLCDECETCRGAGYIIPVPTRYEEPCPFCICERCFNHPCVVGDIVNHGDIAHNGLSCKGFKKYPPISCPTCTPKEEKQDKRLMVPVKFVKSREGGTTYHRALVNRQCVGYLYSNTKTVWSAVIEGEAICINRTFKAAKRALQKALGITEVEG